MEDKTSNLILFADYEITSADADMFGRLRLGALVNFLIQSAIKSADRLGFGFKDLERHQLFWVLSRLTVEIGKTLNWYDKAEVETWPKSADKILYLRDFFVRNQNGEVAAKAASGWFPIDLRTKRPKRYEGEFAEIFVHNKNKFALEEVPEKLPIVNDGDEFEFMPTYFDCDFNKHVTTTRYVDAMMDAFSADFHEKNYPERLSLNFIKETRIGEKIKIIKTETENKKFFFEGKKADGNIVAFRGRIDFREDRSNLELP
ncbi:MAG: hypothetical protein GXO87_07400 [Chlorobi bacterium]|nr:hypothetical protein [Chlorobiota bacterium]